MDYGIAVPSYIDAWREVQAAGGGGFHPRLVLRLAASLQ